MQAAGIFRRAVQVAAVCAAAAILLAASGAHHRVSRSLAGKLVLEKDCAAGPFSRSTRETTVVYVLGGNQESLVSRFGTASRLYHRGVAQKIHILSRAGITEFDQVLKRNLTNDEWAVREMEKLGVKGDDVVPVAVDPRFFGTLNEARSLAVIVREKGIRKIFLVSSRYHTRRVYRTFHNVMANDPVEIYIYGSRDVPGFLDLINEYVKLVFYDKVVLPLDNRGHGG